MKTERLRDYRGGHLTLTQRDDEPIGRFYDRVWWARGQLSLAWSWSVAKPSAWPAGVTDDRELNCLANVARAVRGKSPWH